MNIRTLYIYIGPIGINFTVCFAYLIFYSARFHDWANRLYCICNIDRLCNILHDFQKTKNLFHNQNNTVLLDGFIALTVNYCLFAIAIS